MAVLSAIRGEGGKTMKKLLCKYCNNGHKIYDGYHGYTYMCLGGKKEDIKQFEEDARRLKKWVSINKCWLEEGDKR
jgi:hypothetical protein